MSYRIRGSVARAHKNSITIIKDFKTKIRGWNEVENRETEKRLMAIILVYSAIKIIAKGPALYSILKPETSSDSPSIKSYGVRFVSARIVANQIGIRAGTTRIGHIIKENVFDRANEAVIERATSIQRDIPTSYEIVWAMPRTVPIIAYFEFLAQPAVSVAYTFSLEIAANKGAEY